MTIFHLRDLMSGSRTRIKAEAVKVITVPHFKGLKVEAMFEFALQHEDVMKAFPAVQRERDDLPRPYVANVINTLKHTEFSNWVKQMVNDRHQLRTQQMDTIQMDPEIKRYYDASTAVSGKHLLIWTFDMSLDKLAK